MNERKNSYFSSLYDVLILYDGKEKFLGSPNLGSIGCHSVICYIAASLSVSLYPYLISFVK